MRCTKMLTREIKFICLEDYLEDGGHRVFEKGTQYSALRINPYSIIFKVKDNKGKESVLHFYGNPPTKYFAQAS